MSLVIKIGGHELDDAEFLAALAEAVLELPEPPVIVHGGGKEISALQQQLGITPHFVDGVRVTDEPTLALVTMVLCGTVNKRLVRVFSQAGAQAIGLSGVDLGLVRAKPMPHPTQYMGYTGVVEAVRGEVLRDFLARGVLPILAPISDGASHALNVNADQVAGAVAASIQAERVVFLTNVEGVLHEGRVLPSLSAEQAEALIANGVISGGMIPKVRTALEALQQGVARAVITNLTGLRANGGTVFTQTT